MIISTLGPQRNFTNEKDCFFLIHVQIFSFRPSGHIQRRINVSATSTLHVPLE